MATEQRKYSPQETIQIYTDWANHYLEKCRSKKRITSLAADCSDGVLLAEVIESVTCQKIADINRKPKTPTQMLDNINLCLAVLKAQHVSGVESISALELRDGKLKAILALFFALSRHKQAAKQKSQQQNQQQNTDNVIMTSNRSATIHHKGGSSIPLPGSALPSRRCPPDKVRPVQHQSTSSSRASSPAMSMIPRVPPTYISSPYHQAPPAQKNATSVLDKLKMFKSNNDKPANATTNTNGKRTSSSSGVSSARSERSDSSISLEPNLEPKTQKATTKITNKPIKTTNTTTIKQVPTRNGAQQQPTKKDLILSKQTKNDNKTIPKSVTDSKIKPKSLPLNNLSNTPVCTGIPKPTAAIKGTTKPSPKLHDVETDPKPAIALVSPIKNDDESAHKQINIHQFCPINEQVQKEENSTGDSLKIEPMRPLLGGYCSTLTLPTRSRQYGRIQSDGGTDYCEMLLATGYLSDGEVLRSVQNVPDAVHDGYLSEGGAVLYSRRHQQGMSSTSTSDVDNDASSNHHHQVPPSSLTLLTERESSGRRGRVPLPEDHPAPPPPASSSARSSSSSRQRNGTALLIETNKHGNGPHWKRYTDSPGVGSPAPPPPPPAPQAPPAPAPSSPTSGRSRERRSSPHHSGGSGTKDKNKVRGVPQSFGYVKRGSSTNGTNGAMQNGVAGQVLQAQSGKTASVSVVPRTKVKVSGGTQTCSSDLQPLHTHQPTSAQFKSYSLSGSAASQLSQSVRERLMMGSQSLPKGAAIVGQQIDYGLVLRHHHHGNRPSKISDGSLSDTQAILENTSPYAPWLRHSNTYSVTPRLSETDSMESLTSLPGHRSSLTQHTRLMRDSPCRLSRSNSIRSTKSEKLYPSMLHRNTESSSETEPYYFLPIGSLSHWSQPTSPAPGSGNNRTFPLSPTHTATSTPRHSLPKNDDVHGSSVSLVSTASSLYSSAEEKQAHEIKKLRRELIEAQEKVQTLTSQLSTNAHVVSAFEQSLSSMTQRLQLLSATAERKDSELTELKNAMEALRTQSIQAGITSGLARQPSSDSVSSLSSACSLDKQEKKKKKGWLRSSFTKAFSRNAKVTKVQCQSESEPEQTTPRHPQPCHSPPPINPSLLAPQTDAGQEVAELQKQLREKDLVLTDIRLEALNSAHQLESLKDTVMKMRNEMISLKENNERLQRMVNGSVVAPSPLPTDLSDLRTSSPSLDTLSDLMSTTDAAPLDPEQDGKKITISVYLGQPQSFLKYYAEHYGDAIADTTANKESTSGINEIAIAHTTIGASTSWAQLDNTVRRQFKQHVTRLDPGGGLGLGSDSIAGYRLGEAERKPEMGPPDLLPVGYAVGRVSTLHVVLQPVAALAFETLIPKGVAQRLVSLLFEHRRLVLCGAAGTGKTHLAQKLAEFHAQAQGRDPAEAVATFHVDDKSPKELRQYLSNLIEQASSGPPSDLPSVVVLDNLHKAGPIADALGSLPRNLPCLLGTMAQSACSATSLQLQHGFRWVLVAPHMEPAKGLLSRVLRRRLATLELQQGPQPELAAVLGWLPQVWQHLNGFLETHSSGDVAIGPRLFLGCPLELDAARAWFADVWNYSLAPYLREAAREGLQLYGRRAIVWKDPCQFILDTYPFPGASPQGLSSVSAKDVGLDSAGGGVGAKDQADGDGGDPLLNMLMRLQEAANYSAHSNESDNCNSCVEGGGKMGTESVS